MIFCEIDIVVYVHAQQYSFTVLLYSYQNYTKMVTFLRSSSLIWSFSISSFHSTFLVGDWFSSASWEGVADFSGVPPWFFPLLILSTTDKTMD